MIRGLYLRAEDLTFCGASHSDTQLPLARAKQVPTLWEVLLTVCIRVVSFADILLGQLKLTSHIAQYYTLHRVPRSVFTHLSDKGTPHVCFLRSLLYTYAYFWTSMSQILDLPRTFIMVQTEHLQG